MVWLTLDRGWWILSAGQSSEQTVLRISCRRMVSFLRAVVGEVELQAKPHSDADPTMLVFPVPPSLYGPYMTEDG
jgi:hypothetical protein